MTVTTSLSLDEYRIPGDLDWHELLRDKPYQSALPDALSDARLEQIWADFQPCSEYGLRISLLMAHLIRVRHGLSPSHGLFPNDRQILALTDGYERLVEAERNARKASKSSAPEKQHFLATLDAACQPNGVAGLEPLEDRHPSSEWPYRAAYENDDASRRAREIRERFEVALNCVRGNTAEVVLTAADPVPVFRTVQ